MNLSDLISKYFFPLANEKEFNKWAKNTLEASIDFLYNKDKIHTNKSPNEISSYFRSIKIPEEGNLISTVLKESFDNIVQNSVRLSHPNFIGHMTGTTPNFLHLCDIIISTLNQNVVKIETALAATFVERQTLSWIHNLIYNKEKKFYDGILKSSNIAIGNYCSGGTIGNITALLIARNRAFPNIHKIGIFDAYKINRCKKAVILVSERGHYSIKKSAAIIGIGEQNVISIACEKDSNKIDINELEKTIKKLLIEKTKIISIVGIAGSTETGNIDNLKLLSKIAKQYNIWLHVDAAWGGALLLSNQYKKLLSGIENADSVVIDGHKFMYLTLSHSAVLFKDEHALDSIKHSANYIIREGSIDLGKTTIEGSRRFDALKLWFSFKVLGRKGYELLINNAIKNALILSQLADNHPSFESTSKPETSIVTYRFVHKSLKKKLNIAKELINTSNQEDLNLKIDKYFTGVKNKFKYLINKINLFLNEVNINLQKEQRKNGNSFVSRTLLASIWESQEIVVLRAIPFHPLTNHEILAEILVEQEILGNAFFEKELHNFLKHEPLAQCFFSNI